MKRLSFGLTLLFFSLFSFSFNIQHSYAGSNLTLVELFTSQGCSSCPPADRYFSELAKEKNLAVLAWHVPYWDYIGWRDPFALRASESRQRRYARILGTNQLYTPQAVVGGRLDYTGSDRRGIRKGLRSVRAKGGDAPRLRLSMDSSDNRSFSVVVEEDTKTARANADIVSFDLLLVLFRAFANTEVEKGENRGKNLREANIVISVENLGVWQGEGERSFHFRLPLGDSSEDSSFDILEDGGIVVIAEPRSARKGSVVATRWDFKRGLTPAKDAS